MKFFICAATLICLPVFATIGGEAGNGGDPNEIKFKAVALNIEEWIESGNASALQLPSGISFATYQAGMLAQLKNYEIEFTNDPVTVNGAEKTCKNKFAGSHKILCNSPSFSRYFDGSMDDIYRIVHHEFAGLAGFEENKGQNSDYVISEQLSAFLHYELVKRLPVHSPGGESRSGSPAIGWRLEKIPGQELSIVPFTLDAENPLALQDHMSTGGYKSAATLLKDSVSLSAENGGRKIEIQAEKSVSISREDNNGKLEGEVGRVPDSGPLAESQYRCTLIETGEQIEIGRGTVSVGFPSQKNVTLANGKLTITATAGAVFFTQYNGSAAKATVKFMRGNIWAEMRFSASTGIRALSIDCEMF